MPTRPAVVRSCRPAEINAFSVKLALCAYAVASQLDAFEQASLQLIALNPNTKQKFCGVTPASTMQVPAVSRRDTDRSSSIGS